MKSTIENSFATVRYLPLAGRFQIGERIEVPPTSWSGRNVLYSIGVLFAAITLRREVEIRRTPSEWVDFALAFRRRLKLPERWSRSVSIAPIQIRSEIIPLLNLLKDSKPLRLMEVGSAGGGSLFLFARVAAPTATIIAIDLPSAQMKDGIPTWRIPLYSAFASREQKVQLVRQNSHSLDSLNRAKAILKNQELDFLFIDGDHSYEGVSQDFAMYSPLVRNGGMVGFHDIVPHPPETRCEVNTFWKEIRRSYNYIEFVQDWNQEWGGIGVITKN